MKRRFIGAALLTMAFSPAAAEVYECRMQRGASGGWVSPLIFVGVDSNAQDAVVMDVFTRDVSKDWYPAKLSVDNKKRYTVTWKTGRQKDPAGQIIPSLHMRMTIIKAGLEARVSSQPAGYENFWNTKGKCKLIEK